MSTNYYLNEEELCPCCDQPVKGEVLHIGKNMFKQPFMLHAIPEKGLLTPYDWIEYIHEGVGCEMLTTDTGGVGGGLFASLLLCMLKTDVQHTELSGLDSNYAGHGRGWIAFTGDFS